MTSAKGVIENTLAAAEAAIAGGFAIECDIQLSADGEAIVFHDETLDRLTDASGPGFGPERGGDRENPDQGNGRAAADLRRVSRKRSPAGRRSSASSRAGSTATGASATAPPPSRGLYDGPLAFKSFDHDLAAYLRLRRPHMRAARRPLPDRHPGPSLLRRSGLGFPERRAEARLDGFRPLRPRPPGFPVAGTSTTSRTRSRSWSRN